MEAFARAPDAMPDKGAKDKNWKVWRQEFMIFLKASGLEKPENSTMIANLLMNRIGKVGLEAIQNINWGNPEEKEDFKILLEKLDQYFDPPKKEIEERYKFYTRSKKNNETIEDYVSSLKELSKTCNFGSLTDSLIRDMVIVDIKDKNLRKMIFNQKDLDIPKLCSLYKTFEINTEKMMKIAAESAVKDDNAGSAGNKDNVRKCSKCGTSHAFKACPAFGKQCSKCNEYNHLPAQCTKFLAKGNNPNPNAVKNKNLSGYPFSQINKTAKN